MRNYLFSNKEKENKLLFVSNKEGIIITFLGLIGLSIFATIIVQIFKAFIDLETVSEESLVIYNCYVNVLAYLCVFIILPFILRKNKIKQMFSQFTSFEAIVEGIALGFVLIAANIGWSMIVINVFNITSVNDNQNSIIPMIHSRPILSCALLVIFAPVIEELTYRYALFGALYKKNRLLAYAVTMFIFGMIHFSFQYETMQDFIVEIANIPGYFIAGGILCYCYERKGSLATSIVAHATNNLISFLATISTAPVAN